MSLDLFSDNSRQYAGSRPTYPPELFRWLAENAGGRDAAWDCATGNGQAAAGLVAYFETVYASDLSPQQLENRIVDNGIRFSCQPAEMTNYPDDAFNLITVAQALHWFDFEAFFKEVRRLLKPGGLFAAWGYDWVRVESLQEMMNRELFPALEPYWSERNRFLWNDYQDVPFPLDKVKSPDFKLLLNWTVDDVLAYIESWSATQAYMAEHGRDLLRRTREQIRPWWVSESEPKPIVMRLKTLMGRFQ